MKNLAARMVLGDNISTERDEKLKFYFMQMYILSAGKFGVDRLIDTGFRDFRFDWICSILRTEEPFLGIVLYI